MEKQYQATLRLSDLGLLQQGEKELSKFKNWVKDRCDFTSEMGNIFKGKNFTIFTAIKLTDNKAIPFEVIIHFIDTNARIERFETFEELINFLTEEKLIK